MNLSGSLRLKTRDDKNRFVVNLSSDWPVAGQRWSEAPERQVFDPPSRYSAAEPGAVVTAKAFAAADRVSIAFLRWAEIRPAERRVALAQAADLLDSLAPAFVAAILADTDATEGWARYHLLVAAELLRQAAGMTAPNKELATSFAFRNIVGLMASERCPRIHALIRQVLLECGIADLICKSR